MLPRLFTGFPSVTRLHLHAVSCSIETRYASLQVDRSRVPRHDFTSESEYVAPSNHLEQLVHDAWAAVLSHVRGPISVHANFFQLGGNSLRAGAVCSRIRNAMQLQQPIPLTWIMQHQTIASLAAKLAEEELESSQSDVLPPLLPTISSRKGLEIVAPLSFQQVGATHMPRTHEHLPVLHVVMVAATILSTLCCIISKWLVWHQLNVGPFWLCRRCSSSCGSVSRAPQRITLALQACCKGPWTLGHCRWPHCWCTSGSLHCAPAL